MRRWALAWVPLVVLASAADSLRAAEPQLAIELPDVEVTLPQLSPPHFQKEGLPYFTEYEFVAELLALIGRQDYEGALADLRDLAQDNQQADVYNLLGFTLRKTGDYRTSLTYYTKALEFEPDHKAAREYLGELYVETGDMAKANDQLARLTTLCPNGCEERDDLAKAIAQKTVRQTGN